MRAFPRKSQGLFYTNVQVPLLEILIQLVWGGLEHQHYFKKVITEKHPSGDSNVQLKAENDE